MKGGGQLRGQLQRLVVAPEQIQGTVLTLVSDQQHYLGRVLRLREGDGFLALNGRGQVWMARLLGGGQAQLSPAPAELLLPGVGLPGVGLPGVKLPEVTLVMAVVKQGFEEVIRQGTELGVRRIVPVLTARTVVQPGGGKLDRWQRIAQEAAEQCEQYWVPEVLAPLPWGQALATIEADCRYIGVTHQAAPLLLDRLLAQRLQGSQGQDLGAESGAGTGIGAGSGARSIAIAIGPEGGWTAAEVEQAMTAGYLPVSLGPYILRAVTAPIVALSLMMGAAVSAQAIHLPDHPSA